MQLARPYVALVGRGHVLSVVQLAIGRNVFRPTGANDRRDREVRQKRPTAHLLHGPREHRRYDELDYARLVARRFGTDHHGVLVDEDAMRTFTPELVYHQDEPLADRTGIPQHFVTRLARDTGRI